MSDITIPVPYNGGTLQTGHLQTHYCYLGNGKFLNVAAQTAPNYVFAWVTNDTNIATGTFTSVNPSMRAIMSGTAAPTTINSIRVFKLSATNAAMVLNGTMYVLAIDGSDNVTLTNATLNLGFGVWPVGNAANNGQYYSASGGAQGSTTALGSAWQAFYVRDNVLYTFQNNNNQGTIATLSCSFKKVVYDPVGDALTISALASYAPAGGATNYWMTRAELLDIPGSTTKLLTLRVTSGGAGSPLMAYSTIAYAALIDATDTVTAIPGLAAVGAQALCPLSTTNILGFTSSRTYLTFNGTAWNTSPAYFANSGTTPQASYVFSAFALDSNYFLLLSATVNSPVNQTTPTEPSNPSYAYWAVRIGRFVDSTFAQCSPSTNTGVGGYVMPSAGVPAYTFLDQQFIFRDASSTFYMFGHNGTTPQLRTIYTPGG